MCVYVCARVFLCSPETSASHFFFLLQSCKFSCAHLESHNGNKSLADLCMFLMIRVFFLIEII